jgi:uncharacterized membrane protein YdjX (TVP38/TMEM64 family)
MPETLRWTDRVVPVVAPLALLALLLVSLWQTPAIAAWLQWMEAQGPEGDALFALAYLAGTLALVPASILEGGAGFLYGAAWGVPVASLLGTAGATVGFLLGRTLLRGVVERRIARSPRLVAIDGAVGREGLRLVLLLRLSPLAPFNTLNVLLGATPVRTVDFVLGTALGHLFPVAVFAYVGSTVASAFDLAGTRPPASATAVGLALTLVATVGVSRFAKRALDAALSEGRPS